MLPRLIRRLSRSRSPELPSNSAPTGAFRSLRNRNYRLWAAGAFVSNVGTWMQRTAQDWLVLAELTPHNATAVGIVMALQFGPSLALLPLTGLAADHFDRRKLLFVDPGRDGRAGVGAGAAHGARRRRSCGTSTSSPCCSAASTAFDAPARQTFVSELVGDERSRQRGGAELDVVPGRATDRAGGAGLLIARVRHGLVVPLQRRLVRGRARLAGVAARERAAPQRAAGAQARQPRRGVALRAAP